MFEGQGRMLMNVMDWLFRRSPRAHEIRVQFKEIERLQKRKRRDVELREHEKNEKIREAMAAKKTGRQELLRDTFRDLRQTEIDISHLNTDLRRLSLAKTAVGSFLRRIDTMERTNDRRSLQNLILRFKNSPIQREIDKAEVDDETFNDMLEEILGDEELTVASGRFREDAGFADFDRAVGELVAAETSGPDEADVARLHGEVNQAIRAEKVSQA